MRTADALRGNVFQSTPARERATDMVCDEEALSTMCFNPRPRVSGRPPEDRYCILTDAFQSTPARERATRVVGSSWTQSNVSIHARA